MFHMLGQDRTNYMSGDVGQSKVATLETVGQPLMIDPEQVQHGGVQIVHVDFVLDRGVAKFIRGAVCLARLDASAGHPQ